VLVGTRCGSKGSSDVLDARTGGVSMSEQSFEPDALDELREIAAAAIEIGF